MVGCVPNKQIKQYLGTKVDQFKFTTHAVVENLMLTLTDCTLLIIDQPLYKLATCLQ